MSDQPISPNPGVLSIQAFYLTDDSGNILTDDSGNPLTGDAPISLAIIGLQMTPAKASLTLTGLAPGSATQLQPATGALALTGVASNLGRVISPAVGSAALAGVKSTENLGAQPAAGSAVMTGAAPSLKQQSAPGVGTLALSGTAPGLHLAIIPPAGKLTLIGYGTGDIVPVYINPPSGRVAMGGAAPVLATEPASVVDYVLVSMGPVMALTPSTATVQYFTQGGVSGPNPISFGVSAFGVGAFGLSGIQTPPNSARVKPFHAQYRIDDVCTGVNIVPWTNLAGNETDFVYITPEQNAFVSDSKWCEDHQLLVEAKDLYGNPYHSRVVFWIKRIRGL